MIMDRNKLIELENKTGDLLRFGSPSCIRQAHAIMVENFENLMYFTLDLTQSKPETKHTIADNYPAGGLPEPCQFCLGASEKAEGIISKIDTAIGMITVASEVSPTVREAKELLLQTRVDIGEIFEV